MSVPAVSVIVAAFDAAKFIVGTLDSVRAQGFEDHEVVAVDDGSTDGTGEILDRLAARWPRLRVIRAEHRGLAAARNRAIAAARGEWLALLDADDLWVPGKLERCMGFLAECPSLRIVYSPMVPIEADGTPLPGRTKPCHAGRLTERLFHSIFVHDPAVVFHREVVEACGGFDESLPVSVGHEYWLRVSTRFEFGLIDEPLALRRCHERSLTRSDRARSRVAKARMLERFYLEGGGREILEPREAARRLASVHYKAGRILLARRRHREAVELLDGALRWRPSFPAARALRLAAAVLARVGRLTASRGSAPRGQRPMR